MRWFGKRKPATPVPAEQNPTEVLRPEEVVVRTPAAMLADMPSAPVEDWMAHVGGPEPVVTDAPEPTSIVLPRSGKGAKPASGGNFAALEKDVSPEEGALHSLTPRERDVFNLLMEGKTLKQISECLGVKFSTVNTHYKSVYRKLNVNSRAEFILRYGLVGRDG